MATTCYQERDAAVYLIHSHIHPLDEQQKKQLQNDLANLVLSCLSIKQTEEAPHKKKRQRKGRA